MDVIMLLNMAIASVETFFPFCVGLFKAFLKSSNE